MIPGNSAGFGGLAPVASTGTGGMGSRRSMASIGSIRGSRAIPMGMGGMPGMGMQGLGGMGGMHPGFGMGIMGSPMMGLPMGMQQFGAMGTPPMMMLSNSYLTMVRPFLLDALNYNRALVLTARLQQNPPFLPGTLASFEHLSLALKLRESDVMLPLSTAIPFSYSSPYSRSAGE